MGLGSLASLGAGVGVALSYQDIPPVAQPPHVGVGLSRFTSPLLLPVSMWSLIYILSYKSSGQLVFRLFSRLTVS